MGFFDTLFGNRPKPVGTYEGKFKMISGYEPRFTSYQGSIYESELIRCCINARATHISKLKVNFIGSARPELKRKLAKKPNSFQTWTQFLYQLSTILDVHNTAFICPTFNQFGEVDGIVAPVVDNCEVVTYGGVPYLRYKFKDGNSAAIEMSLCGRMTKFQYKDMLFGETNHALFPTLDLIEISNQGVKEATKSSAAYRFWAKVTNFTKGEDLAKERKRFTDDNFSREANGGGMLLFPNTYTDIHQIEAKPWVVSADERKVIQTNAFNYFMVNEDILQNKAIGDKWNAFYEGCVECFAIQFSEVMSNMFYSLTEQSYGNEVMATSNRLQYMSNADKLNVSSQLADRGILNRDEVREIWNLPPLPNGEGQTYIIRGEYWNATDKVVNSLDNEGGANNG